MIPEYDTKYDVTKNNGDQIKVLIFYGVCAVDDNRQ